MSEAIVERLEKLTKGRRQATSRIDVGSLEFFEAVCERAFGLSLVKELSISFLAGIRVVEDRRMPPCFAAVVEDGQTKAMLDLRALAQGE